MTTVAENEEGQSVFEFLLMLPVMIGLVMILIEVNQAIQMSIVDQQYARADATFLAFNSPVYPELDLRTSQLDGKNYNQMMIGVMDNLATDGNAHPNASTQSIIRPTSALIGSNAAQTEPSSRSTVRVRDTVTLCTQSEVIGAGGQSAPILSQGGAYNLPDNTSINWEFCQSPIGILPGELVMNNRALTLSLVMAILAVFFVQSYVSNIEDEAQKRFGTQVNVVVAKQDIHEDDDINETMLELKPIPKKFLEPGAISFEKTTDQSQVTKGLQSFSGMVAIVPIKKGEQISFNKVVEPGVRTGLAPEITPGRRAISVPVSEISGVGKLVKPGDRVDVIAVLDMGGGKENRIAKTILQDVGVLAVGHNVTGNVARQVEPDLFSGKDRIRPLATDVNFTTVTLEVDPVQAQSLALIMNNSNNVVMLSLRNNDDTDRQNVISTSLADVLGTDATRMRFPAGTGRR